MSAFPPSLIRRVVVTGVGAVTPLGHDAESFWQGARAGRSGVRRVEGFGKIARRYVKIRRTFKPIKRRRR